MKKIVTCWRVLEAAKESWSWAFWLVKKQLNDGPRTPEIVEDVAADVSNRLRADAEAGRNLNGYLTRGFAAEQKPFAPILRRPLSPSGRATSLAAYSSFFCAFSITVRAK